MEETTDYCQHFDPELFLGTYYSSVDADCKDGIVGRFLLDSLHNIFTSDVNFGDRMLDVGSGPTILSVLSASRRVQHLDLSDFTPRNLEVLRDWKNGKKSEVQCLVQYEMELAGDNRLISEREADLRSAVQEIHRIDVTKEDVFQDNVPRSKAYDVITSCFCLESVSNNKDIYRLSVRNMCKLLKAGGYLVLLGGIEETNYRVGNFLFQVTHLKEEEIQAIYEENGFEILKWITLLQGYKMPKSDGNYISDYKNVFAMFAKKGI